MHVVVLTGAGISKESGLPTFRDADGLWEGHDVMEVATPEAFERNPELVYRFYNERRASLPSVHPNAAHHALAELEETLGDRFLLVTQNVDDLHERAGSKRLLHMHGSLLEVRNERGDVLPWTGPLGASDRCPHTGTRLRPNVVWFGEMPLFMDEIGMHLSRCSHFCAIGTSGVVYPAADFSRVAWKHQAHTVEINVEATGGTFHERLLGPATNQVPLWAEAVRRDFAS